MVCIAFFVRVGLPFWSVQRGKRQGVPLFGDKSQALQSLSGKRYSGRRGYVIVRGKPTDQK